MKIKSTCWIPLLLLILFAAESRAQITLEAGAAFLSSDFADGGVLMLSDRIGKYDFALGYITTQFVDTCGRPDCRNDLRENIFIHAQRIFEYKRLEFGIGPSYFQNTNRALSRRLNISVMINFRITKRSFIFLRHFSNFGSGPRNLGQDMLNLGVRFY